MSHTRLNKLANELAPYPDLDGAEVGEYTGRLIDVSQYSYCMGDEFLEALTKEMESQLKAFRTRTRIVRKKETHTREYDELIWLEEAAEP